MSNQADTVPASTCPVKGTPDITSPNFPTVFARVADTSRPVAVGGRERGGGSKSNEREWREERREEREREKVEMCTVMLLADTPAH